MQLARSCPLLDASCSCQLCLLRSGKPRNQVCARGACMYARMEVSMSTRPEGRGGGGCCVPPSRSTVSMRRPGELSEAGRPSRRMPRMSSVAAAADGDCGDACCCSRAATPPAQPMAQAVRFESRHTFSAP